MSRLIQLTVNTTRFSGFSTSLKLLNQCSQLSEKEKSKIINATGAAVIAAKKADAEAVFLEVSEKVIAATEAC